MFILQWFPSIQVSLVSSLVQVQSWHHQNHQFSASLVQRMCWAKTGSGQRPPGHMQKRGQKEGWIRVATSRMTLLMKHHSVGCPSGSWYLEYQKVVSVRGSNLEFNYNSWTILARLTHFPRCEIHFRNMNIKNSKPCKSDCWITWIPPSIYKFTTT
jgi:hypothetical protein